MFDKVYPNRKDWRKQYYKAKAFDRSCRNHGACGYCLDSRTHKHKRKSPIVDQLKYDINQIEDNNELL